MKDGIRKQIMLKAKKSLLLLLIFWSVVSSHALSREGLLLNTELLWGFEGGTFTLHLARKTLKTLPHCLGVGDIYQKQLWRGNGSNGTH